MLAANEIRAAAMKSGEQVRTLVATLPDSPSKAEFQDLSEQMLHFWQHTASDDFCRQWLKIALISSIGDNG